MYIENMTIKDEVHIFLYGELDEYSAADAKEYIDRIIETSLYPRIVLDFSKLNFMDSTGVGVIIGRFKKSKQFNKLLYIVNPSSHIDKVLKTSGVYTIIQKIS